MWLTRSNAFELNSIMFGVYRGFLNHNSCGSLAKVGRPYTTPGAPADSRRMCYEGDDIHLRDLDKEQVLKLI